MAFFKKTRGNSGDDYLLVQRRTVLVVVQRRTRRVRARTPETLAVQAAYYWYMCAVLRFTVGIRVHQAAVFNVGILKKLT